MPETTAPPLLEPRFLHQLEQLELVSRKIFLGLMKGERRSKRKGQSVEFADYRNSASRQRRRRSRAKQRLR